MLQVSSGIHAEEVFEDAFWKHLEDGADFKRDRNSNAALYAGHRNDPVIVTYFLFSPLVLFAVGSQHPVHGRQSEQGHAASDEGFLLTLTGSRSHLAKAGTVQNVQTLNTCVQERNGCGQDADDG